MNIRLLHGPKDGKELTIKNPPDELFFPSIRNDATIDIDLDYSNVEAIDLVYKFKEEKNNVFVYYFQGYKK